MALADFAGGVQDAIAEIIKQRLEAEEVKRREKQHADELGLRTRGLEQGVQRIGLDRDQFTYQQTRDTKSDTDAADTKTQIDGFIRGLPTHLQAPAQGAQYGINFKPEDVINPPETREEREARERGQTTFQTDENIRQTRATRPPA